MGNHRQPHNPIRITKVDDADINRMIGGEAEQQAELYRHMLECAKASGFGSLSEAIARAVKAEAKLIEQEQAHLAAIGQMVRERDKDMEETRAILERAEKVEAENAKLREAARLLQAALEDLLDAQERAFPHGMPKEVSAELFEPETRANEALEKVRAALPHLLLAPPVQFHQS